MCRILHHLQTLFLPFLLPLIRLLNDFFKYSGYQLIILLHKEKFEKKVLQINKLMDLSQTQKKILFRNLHKAWASLVAQRLKHLPAMRESCVRSLGLGRSPGGGHGNPLQYSCLENPHGQRSLAGYSPWGHKELDTTE